MGFKDMVLCWMVIVYIEFLIGVLLDWLLVYYFDEDEEFWGEDVILIEGYDWILVYLVDGLDIWLNILVDMVEYEEGDGVVVYMFNGIFEFNFVICIVLFGVLKVGIIVFDLLLFLLYQ